MPSLLRAVDSAACDCCPPAAQTALHQQIREYLSLKHAGLAEDPRPAIAPPSGSIQAYHASIAEDSADGQLAASAAWTLADLSAAAQQLVASRDLSAPEAELAAANLALLQGGGSGNTAEEGSSGGAAQRQHVWYGDPLLSTGETRHSVEVRIACVCCQLWGLLTRTGADEMGTLLCRIWLMLLPAGCAFIVEHHPRKY